MITLPQNLKNSIKDSPVTSLNCFIHIYSDNTTSKPLADQPIDQNTVIKLALSEFSLNKRDDDGMPPHNNAESYIYKPLLTKAPSITNKIDFITNKHTISSAKISINNILYKGEVFSDSINSLMGCPVEIYFFASSAEFIDDAMLAYTGVIKRYVQSTENVDLTLEDISTFKYDQKVPQYAFAEDDESIHEAMRGKPLPMIYGYNNYVPALTIREFDTSTETWNFSSLIYEKPTVKTLGLIENPNNPYSKNPYLKNSSHIINQAHYTQYCRYNDQEWPKDYLYVQKEGRLLPVMRQILSDMGVQQYEGVSVAQDLAFGTLVYNEPQNHRIQFTPDYKNAVATLVSQIEYSLSNQEEPIPYNGSTWFLPSRIYRPIKRIDFFDSGLRWWYGNESFNDGDENGKKISRTLFFGISPHRANSVNGEEWNPTADSDLINNGLLTDPHFASFQTNWTTRIEKTTLEQYLYNHSSEVEGAKTWWFSWDFIIGRSYSDGVPNTMVSTKDTFWTNLGLQGEQSENVGDFPVHYIQNGNNGYGMFVESSIAWGENSWGYAKLIFDDYWEGSQIECDTKFFKREEVSFSVAASDDFNKLPQDGGYYDGNYYIGMSTLNTVGFMGFTKNDKPITEAMNWWNSGNDDNVSNAYEYYAKNKNDVLKWFDEVEGNVFKGFGGGSDSYENYKYNGWPYGPEHWESYGDNFIPEQDEPFVREYLDENERHYDHDKIMPTLGSGDYINWAAPAQLGYYPDDLLYSHTRSLLTDFYMFQDVLIDDPDNQQYFVSIAGRIFNDERDDFDENDNRLPIQTPDKILAHIFDEELGGNTRWFDFTNVDPEFNAWRMNFVVANEQVSFKSLLEGMFAQTLCNTRFEPNGQISFLARKRYLRSGMESEGIEDNFTYSVIDTDHIKKYRFSLTKSDDIYNSVNVSYDWDYINNSPLSETGSFIKSNDNSTIYEYYDDFSFEYYRDLGKDALYQIIDYNIDNSMFEIDADKIQDLPTARKLQRKLLMWYANQHLIIECTLSNSYIDLQIGDYIEFDKLIDDKKAFGWDYTKNHARNGQLIYNKFIITETKKDGNSVQIKAIQAHRLELGFPDGFFDPNVDYYDNGNIVDQDGNNLNYLFDVEQGVVIPPTIIDDDDIIEEDAFVGDYFKANWIPSLNYTQDTETLKYTKGEEITAVIESNVFDENSELFYKLIFVKSNNPVTLGGNNYDADTYYGVNVTDLFSFQVASTDNYSGRIITITPNETFGGELIPDNLVIDFVLYASTVSFDSGNVDIPTFDELVNDYEETET